MDGRLRREQEFHDEVFTGDRRAPTDRFYAVNAPSRSAYLARIAAASFGKRALEYGCATGSHAFFLARNGAEVLGIDLSGEALEQARRKAIADGLAGRVEFRRMDAEALELPDESFDLVCGTGILHHLDLSRALPELARVLRPSGRAVFLEPLGHNPLINLYRRATPRYRTADEHPLRLSDLERARERFGRIEARHFHLTTLLAVPLRTRAGFDALVSALAGLDAALFRMLPPIRRLAWQVVVELSSPRRAAVSLAPSVVPGATDGSRTARPTGA